MILKFLTAGKRRVCRWNPEPADSHQGLSPAGPRGKVSNSVRNFQIFVIRAILGAFFAVILSRFFYPDANLVYVIGLGIILVGLAYFSEYLRQRKKHN